MLNNFDYLLVNSTNEFLEEYNDLNENARYKLTGFTGSTGDALLTKDGKIYLFVDGRYHAQADLEVDHKKIEVVKLQIGETFVGRLFDILPQNSVLSVVSKKISQGELLVFKKFAKVKNIKIKLLDFDPILPETDIQVEKNEVSVKLGLSTKEKIKLITKDIGDNDGIFTANKEEISYILNKRDFSSENSSSVKRQKIIITKKGIFDINHKVSGTIYADKRTTNAYDFKKLKAKPLKINPVKQMKAVKTKDEIEHLKYCFKQADKALFDTREFIEKYNNLSEYDISKFLEEKFYKYGAKGLSFNSIVAKDKNSAQAHYSKCSKKEVIKDGSLVLIDCGAYFEGGLATDATRVFVKGQPSDLQKEVYTKVLKAFLNSISKKISHKSTGFDIDKTARDILNKIKPDGFEFSHSLGHGIGISVHENPPSLSPSKLGKTILKPYMCFTIEPGLYNERYFGVRLENSCYLDEDYKIQSFSNMCFEKKLIDFNLLTKKEKEVLSKWI